MTMVGDECTPIAGQATQPDMSMGGSEMLRDETRNKLLEIQVIIKKHKHADVPKTKG